MDLDETPWGKVVALVQSSFRDWNLAEECTLQIVVLITKGDIREFRGIVFGEVLWKATMDIINQRLTSAI